MKAFTGQQRQKLHGTAVFIANVVRFCLAITLVFSGSVKLNDPIGTVYKLQEYLTAWKLPMPHDITVLGAVALSVVEFTLGIYLFFGISLRKTSRVTLAFFILMTLLTAYIVIFNPVDDCGCFGDAMKLTNIQTFLKNILLLGMTIIVIWKQQWQVKLLTSNTSWILSLFTLFYAFMLSYHSIKYLPVVDYRPFHIGASIPEGMEVPEDEQPVFESSIIYEKDGQRITVDAEDEEPDSTWNYVETQTKLVKEGGKPKIANFYIYDLEHDMDVTEDILYDEGYTFLLISHDLKTADDGTSGRINDIYDYCMANGYGFYCVTASNSTSISHWVDHTGAEYSICLGEEQTLMSMVRANPGLVLLHGGKVVMKWSNLILPTEEELNKPLEEMGWDEESERDVSKQTTKLVLMFFVPLICLIIIDRIAARWAFYRMVRRKTKSMGKDRKGKNINDKLNNTKTKEK